MSQVRRHGRMLTVYLDPPTNESTFHSWTVGPVFYSSVIMAEALGRTNTSRVIDLQKNNASIYTPGYAI